MRKNSEAHYLVVRPITLIAEGRKPFVSLIWRSASFQFLYISLENLKFHLSHQRSELVTIPPGDTKRLKQFLESNYGEAKHFTKVLKR